MVPVPADSGHSPNCPPPGRTELGVTEDLGVTCGGWRDKGREGQEPRDSELNGASWNATSYQGAWGLSLPIWVKGDLSENGQGPVFTMSPWEMQIKIARRHPFSLLGWLQTQQTYKSGQAGKVRAPDAPADV